MIKFFRRIRQNLLSKGKTGKYFKYAIGEIVLVMIGILLALQVNNWNENQKKRIIEKEVISSLHNDFQSAKLEIVGLIKLLDGRNDKLSTLSKNCSLKKTPTISQEAMDSLIWGGYALPTFNPPNGTLSDLLSSGKIDVIRNKELRKSLSEWNGAVEEVKRQELFQGEFLYQRYTPFIEERVEFKHPRFEKHMNMEKADRFPIDSRDLLQDVRFCNLVRRSIYFNLFVKWYYQGVERRIDKIIELTQIRSLTDLIDKENGVDRIIDIIKKGDAEEQGYYISEKLLNDLGYDFVRQGRNNEALKLLKLNTEIYPDASNTYDSYGEILLKIGNKENAIKAYKKSLELNPNNVNAKKVLSEIK
jgi:hypothetical protein